MDNKIISIIPARMNSSRFPGKPMAKINGKPMIGHVYDNVVKNKDILETYVATCDEEIFNYIKSINGKAIMTSKEHTRASDRCAEALLKIEKYNNDVYDIIVMVQGDEPMIKSDMISEAIKPMIEDEKILITNLLGEINDERDIDDRNCIKVVCKLNGDAMYFSREPIPSRSLKKNIKFGKQVCLIPFKRDFLLTYNELKPTPLEIIESIDMLRILENGLNVKMVKTKHHTFPVDTHDDLLKVENLIKK